MKIEEKFDPDIGGIDDRFTSALKKSLRAVVRSATDFAEQFADTIESPYDVLKKISFASGANETHGYYVELSEANAKNLERFTPEWTVTLNMSELSQLGELIRLELDRKAVRWAEQSLEKIHGNHRYCRNFEGVRTMGCCGDSAVHDDRETVESKKTRVGDIP